jgi:L-asparaginase
MADGTAANLADCKYTAGGNTAGGRAVAGANLDRRRVLLINTGGTMSMRPTPSGLAPAPGYLRERIATMEEFAFESMPECTVEDFEPLLDSSDFSPVEWVAIAKCIERHYLEYDAFVVVMGTDTLAYCASALAFMLENLSKPVIVTGSQVRARGESEAPCAC